MSQNTSIYFIDKNIIEIINSNIINNKRLICNYTFKKSVYNSISFIF